MALGRGTCGRLEAPISWRGRPLVASRHAPSGVSEGPESAHTLPGVHINDPERAVAQGRRR